MAVHKILTEPNPLLHQISKPVTLFDARLETLFDEMLETMYEADGIGLAAPQVGILKRLLVIDLRGRSEEAGNSTDASGLFRIVNPEIIWVSDKDRSYQEGCLSIPDHYVDVERPAEVRVRYQDEKGARHELFAEGLLAVCMQHEIDHLDGITLLDHEAARQKHATLRSLLKP